VVAAGAALVLMAIVPAASAQTTDVAEPIPIEEIHGVLYLVDADGTPHGLDVYRPTEVGLWPIVVMIHGAGLTGEWLHDWASAVAEQGAVVFVPTYGLYFFPTVEEQRAEFQRETGQVACAALFARAKAQTYGGDPSNLTIFGHSAGAAIGSVIAFGDPTIPQGCVADSGAPVPENLVLFEGDYLLMDHRFFDFWNCCWPIAA
jgi:acetyl esterase/lipase